MPRRVVKQTPPAELAKPSGQGANKQQPEIKSEQPVDNATLAVRALLRRAKEARKSLSAFYDLVMKHELTKENLIAAPHQRLMFSFIESYDRCVIRMPVGTGKTFGMAAATLYLIGEDVTQRGAIVSKTRSQAEKPLSMVSDYITDPVLGDALRLVYPNLRQSMRANDQWTQSSITVERPAGIRDPSLLAVGVDGAITGARLSWLLGDDIIDDENTRTEASKSQLNSRFDGRLMSRLDPTGSKAVVTNTPWDPEDLTYHLEKNAGWPTLTMDIYGFIWLTNCDAHWLAEVEEEHIRPSRNREGAYRLKAFDPDPEEQIPLWPERYSVKQIREIRYGKHGKGGMLPHEFARSFLCQPMDSEAARCHRSWIEMCKKRGLGTSLVSEYRGEEPTYTGVDLGIGTKKKNDRTCFFTFAVEPDGSRRLLDIESGRFDGSTIIEKLIRKHDAYNSTVAVETVQGQDFLRQWALKTRRDLMIKAHVTSTDKHRVDFGVESIFNELQNESWIIPCDHEGNVHPEIQKWIDGMLYYQPTAHTSDHLMACWIARERARKSQRSDPMPSVGRRRKMIVTGGF